jgi:VCBS repeat-containing protein
MTDFEDQGTHKVTIKATDGINSAEKEITIVVKDVNRAPVFETGAFD